MSQRKTLWDANELATLLQGKWISGDPHKLNITGVCCYPSYIREGDLKFSTVNEQWARESVARSSITRDMIASGVVACVIGKNEKIPSDVPNDFPLLLVEDAYDALIELGKAARRRFQGKVIGITGSVGKSSTKECLKHMLRNQGQVKGTHSNYNMLIQIAMIMAQTPADYDYAIVEMSASYTRELNLLKADIVQPHVFIVTDIQADHIEGHGSMDNIAVNKATMFERLAENATIVLNRDIEFFPRLQGLAKEKGIKNIMTFGEHEAADLRLSDCVYKHNHSKGKLTFNNKAVEFVLGQPGTHMVVNACGALAALVALKLDLGMCLDELVNLPGHDGRFKREQISLSKGSFTFIDDTFNANPASMKSGLALFALLSPQRNGRRIALIGDMGELGDLSDQCHRELATHLTNAGIDKVFCYGEHVAHTYHALPEKLRGLHTESADEIKAALLAAIQDGDILWAKGGAHARLSTNGIPNYIRHFPQLSEIIDRVR